GPILSLALRARSALSLRSLRLRLRWRVCFTNSQSAPAQAKADREQAEEREATCRGAAPAAAAAGAFGAVGGQFVARQAEPPAVVRAAAPDGLAGRVATAASSAALHRAIAHRRQTRLAVVRAVDVVGEVVGPVDSVG